VTGLVAVLSGLDTRDGDGLGCNAMDCRRAESVSTSAWPRLELGLLLLLLLLLLLAVLPKTLGEGVLSGE
jgi:hypothetical protein